MTQTSEFDAFGSSTFIQSAAYNIILERDKEAESDIIRNTTRARMPKCRKGITGKCGDWYFDFKTRQLYDFEDHFGVAFEDAQGEDVKFKSATRTKTSKKEDDKPPFIEDNGGKDSSESSFDIEGESFD
jgi:hypothetical protein